MTIQNTANVGVVKSRIYEVRGLRVMPDRDLAELYGVETRVPNQAVRRNIDRFPEDFMFVMTEDEMNIWKSQIVMSNSIRMGMRRPPIVFTEQIEAVNGALDQLREKPAKPRKRIGYKQ